MPPLRARLEDLELLCPHFIGCANERNGLSIQGITEDAYALLRGYFWPGNIRELEHTIERACVVQQEGFLTAAQFDFLTERMETGDTSPRKNTRPLCTVRAGEGSWRRGHTRRPWVHTMGAEVVFLWAPVN